MTQAERNLPRRLAVLAHAQQTRNVSKTCRFFGISRDSYYSWRKAPAEGGHLAGA